MDKVILCNINYKVQITTLQRIGQLRSGVRHPLNCFFLEGFVIFLPSVNWWKPSLSHWSYNLVILALNGLFQHTSDAWVYFVCTHLEWSHYLHSSPSNLFSRCQSYDIRKSPKLKVACWTKSYLNLVLPRW